MQEEQSITNGTPKRESSGPVACGENEDSSRARGELRGRGRRGRSPSGNLDLWGLEDSDENFVHSSQQRYISSYIQGLWPQFFIIAALPRRSLPVARSDSVTEKSS